MKLLRVLRATLLVLIVTALACPASAAPPTEIDPKALTDEQKELLNHAYLPLRMDLLPAINISSGLA